MKKIIFLLMFFCFCREGYSQKDSSNGLTNISIKSSKDVYLESEPVWIEFDVNVNKDIKVNKSINISRSSGSLKFILIDEKGDTVKNTHSIGEWVYLDNPFRLEHYYEVINLTPLEAWYMEKIPDSLITDGYRIRPGKYRFRAVLFLTMGNKGYPYGSDREIRSYPFYSNEIQFEVKKAEGAEAEAREKIFEMIRKWHNADIDKILGNGPRNVEFIESADEFKKIYPNSVYWDFVENNMLWHSDYVINSNDSMPYGLLNLIQEKPNNYFNSSYISHILYSNPDKVTYFQDTLKHISELYKGTLLQKLIDSQIEKNNEWNLYMQKNKRKQKD